MRSIYIAIPDEAADKLRELARREFRAPRQQAAILVIAGLRRARLDVGPPPEGSAEPAVSADELPQRRSRKVRRIAPLDRPG